MQNKQNNILETFRSLGSAILLGALTMSCSETTPEKRATTNSGPATEVGEELTTDADGEEVIAAQPELISGSFLTMAFNDGDTDTEIVLKGNIEDENGKVKADILNKYTLSARFVKKSTGAVTDEIPLYPEADFLFTETVLKEILPDNRIEVIIKDQGSDKQHVYEMDLAFFSGNALLPSLTSSKTVDLAAGLTGTHSSTSYCDKDGPKDTITSSDPSNTQPTDFTNTVGQKIEFGTSNYDCFVSISSSPSTTLAASDRIFPNAAWGPFKEDRSPSCIFAIMSNNQETSVSKLQVFAVSGKDNASNILMTIHAHTCDTRP